MNRADGSGSPMRGQADRIAVTSPSAGVGSQLRPRLGFCVKHLRDVGYDVVIGECMDGSVAVVAR